MLKALAAVLLVAQVATLNAPGARQQVFYNRGTIYESQGDFESAVADFKEAYKLAPDEPRIREKLEALNSQP